jgi:hypothetical protein
MPLDTYSVFGRRSADTHLLIRVEGVPDDDVEASTFLACWSCGDELSCLFNVGHPEPGESEDDIWEDMVFLVLATWMRRLLDEGRPREAVAERCSLLLAGAREAARMADLPPGER